MKFGNWKSIRQILFSLFLTAMIDNALAQKQQEITRRSTFYTNQVAKVDSEFHALQRNAEVWITLLNRTNNSKSLADGRQLGDQLTIISDKYQNQYEKLDQQLDIFQESGSNLPDVKEALHQLNHITTEMVFLEGDVYKALTRVQKNTDEMYQSMGTLVYGTYSTIKIIDAFSKIDRTKSVEFGNVNSGDIWIGVGYAMPNQKSNALYNQAATIMFDLGNFGKHFMSSYTAGYLYSLKQSKEYYAQIFKVDPQIIQSVGNLSSIFANLSWGPYLLHSRRLAILASLGGKYESFSDFELISSEGLNSIQFKEFSGGGPLSFTYGLVLKYISNNFSIAAAYNTQPSNKHFTPQYTYETTIGNYYTNSYNPHNYNTSAYMITLEYRLF